MGIENPVLRAAAGLDPSVPAALGSGDLFLLPRFTFDFQCPFAPEYSGPVVVRFANVGDAVLIDRLVGQGGFFAEAVASMRVLIEQAPPAWWRLPDGAREPVLDLDRLPDVEGLLDLYRAYSLWRNSFRASSIRG